MNMVEKVARALCIAGGNENPDMETDPDGKPAWTHYAGWSRAAIEAMREPTPIMKKAGSRASCIASELSAMKIHQAMIDAALSE